MLQGDFQLYYPPYTTPAYIRIKAFDINNNELLFDPNNQWLLGLSSPAFPWLYQTNTYFEDEDENIIYHPGYVIDIFDNENQVSNSGWFSIDYSVSKVEIYTYFETTGTGGTIYVSSNKTEINFTSAQNAFNVSNTSGNSCQTFDDFNASVANILDGFCGNITSKITDHPFNVAYPPTGLEISYSLGDDANLSAFENHCDQCNNVSAPPPSQMPNPVTCGCVLFNMELTIEPCPEYYQCPSLILDYDIQICCRCDVRSQDPID
jgi:hypothetical protein